MVLVTATGTSLWTNSFILMLANVTTLEHNYTSFYLIHNVMSCDDAICDVRVLESMMLDAFVLKLLIQEANH